MSQMQNECMPINSVFLHTVSLHRLRDGKYIFEEKLTTMFFLSEMHHLLLHLFLSQICYPVFATRLFLRAAFRFICPSARHSSDYTQ